MTELSSEAQAALERLRGELGSDGERERVRNRLARLGLIAAAGGALGHASGATASAAASSTQALPGVGSGAQSLIASGASPVAGAASATTASSTVAAASALHSGGAAMATMTGLATKLATLPLALKASAASVLLASALTLPLALPAAPTDEPARPQTAPSRHERTLDSVRLPRPHPEPMQRSRDEHGARAAPSARPSSLVPPTERRTSAAAAAQAPGASSTPARRPGASAPKPYATAVRVEQRVSPLADESALLERAVRSLRAGAFERARSLLDEHERRHGARALLAREREQIRAELAERTR